MRINDCVLGLKWDIYAYIYIHPTPTTKTQNIIEDVAQRMQELEDREECYVMLSSVHGSHIDELTKAVVTCTRHTKD